jgi:hypothetical protein
MTKIEVIEPAGEVQKLAAVKLNPVGSLSGRRLAILDNRKPNFNLLATTVAETLKTEHGLASIEHFSKENAAVGAGAELLNRIAQSADVVLTGSAD